MKDTYNKIAKDYVKDHGQDTWDDEYIQYFAAALFSGAKALDLGCGLGLDAAKLAKYGLMVEGFDLSDELLKIAKEINPHMTFNPGDMRDLPYADDSFDGVFAKASLLHIAKKDIEEVLAEIKRILKSGAAFYMLP